ncbi:proline/glycine betaine ABC transporter permease [Desulfovibrio sp. OttesenSCG-928-F20]|nr:proline/glycine betaine ABC transporter permease [Desulfovibrio sp. OttesenSCG-928-F20]
MTIPRIPLGDWISSFLDFFVLHVAPATRAFSGVVETGINLVESGLMAVPPPITILFFALLAWLASKKIGLPLFTVLGFSLIWSMDFWPATMTTLSMVVVATFLAMLIGIPLGILAGISRVAERCITPVLDIMQTMPSFVYLIPTIPLFGLGKVAAVFATLVFALPPAIRMTCLGIRQVPEELVECAEAFGATRWQRLVKLELPLAAPTILAGINQTVMLALSMVVVAAMIGARGLGGEVWKAIQRLNVGLGFEAGIGIVIIAIFLDRILQKLGVRTARHWQP